MELLASYKAGDAITISDPTDLKGADSHTFSCLWGYWRSYLKLQKKWDF